MSCTNTTALGIQYVPQYNVPVSLNDVGATTIINGNTLSASINYNANNATTSYHTFQIVCQNVGGHAAAGSNSV